MPARDPHLDARRRLVLKLVREGVIGPGAAEAAAVSALMQDGDRPGRGAAAAPDGRA
jgi:hypothetical protein